MLCATAAVTAFFTQFCAPFPSLHSNFLENRKYLCRLSVESFVDFTDKARLLVDPPG